MEYPQITTHNTEKEQKIIPEKNHKCYFLRARLSSGKDKKRKGRKTPANSDRKKERLSEERQSGLGKGMRDGEVCGTEVIQCSHKM